MNTTMAIEFLTRCFSPDETIAILLRRKKPAKVAQRIVRLDQAVAPAYMRWLAHENVNGMNIYVAANPLRSGSRRRTKENVASIRHLYIDIDFDGDARVAALRSSAAVPEPTAIISTSSGKYQLVWRVERFDFEHQERALKQLAIVFGGDPACTDCNRVIRIPGFHNTKYTPAYPVSVKYLSDLAANPEDFRLADPSPESALPLRGNARPGTAAKNTHSEQDWAWVLSELSEGKDAAQLTEALAARRTDKPNPLYYAQRTVDMASARLALLAGTSLPDVINSLEIRRSAELPAALCSARAREIVRTAAHMIARQKLARITTTGEPLCPYSKSIKPDKSARQFG